MVEVYCLSEGKYCLHLQVGKEATGRDSLAHSQTLKMEAITSFKMPVDVY
jgi:hypothetical protein